MYKIEKTIAELYIFLLPFRMFFFLSRVEEMFRGSAIQFDILLHILGLALFALQIGKVKFKKDTHSLLVYFLFMVCLFNMMTLLNSLVRYQAIGTVNGETTLTAPVGQFLYWIQYFLIVLYNARVFQLVPLSRILSILKKVSIAVLIIGYLQMLLIASRSGVLVMLNDWLAKTEIIKDSAYLLRGQRITLIASEPAYAGNIIVRLILPVILADILYHQANIKNILFLLAWVPILYATKSTNAYLLIAVQLAVFCVLLFLRSLKKVRFRTQMKRYQIILCLGGIAAILLLPVILMRFNFKDLTYYLIYKLSDDSNMSRGFRIAPFSMNWGVFRDNPVFGIGNGNQGFFYFKYLPEEIYQLIKGTKAFKRSLTEISNGILFIPSILSGYGLVGMSVFIGFLVMCLRKVQKWKEDMGMWYYYYIIGMTAFLVNGFSTDFVGYYDAWFVVSIPFCIEGIKKNMALGEQGSSQSVQCRCGSEDEKGNIC